MMVSFILSQNIFYPSHDKFQFLSHINFIVSKYRSKFRALTDENINVAEIIKLVSERVLNLKKKTN